MMKSKGLWAVVILVVLCSPQVSGQERASWMQLTLMSSEKTPFALDTLQNHPYTVLLFLDPECPVTQKYGATLRQLSHQFKEQQVAVAAIYSQVGMTAEKVNAFAEAYQFSFPQLLDTQLQLATALEAAVTPEAFLINPQGQVLYHGAINNWFYALGRYRQVITEEYLQDAVDATLSGEEITVKETKAIGCMLATGKMDKHHHE